MIYLIDPHTVNNLCPKKACVGYCATLCNAKPLYGIII